MAHARYVTGGGRGSRNFRLWIRAEALTKRSTPTAEKRTLPARLEEDAHALPTAAEVRWASVFYARTDGDDFCCCHAQFDDRCLVGLPAFYAAQSCPILRKQRDVQSWRHHLEAPLDGRRGHFDEQGRPDWPVRYRG